jgi:hypothetical protein
MILVLSGPFQTAQAVNPVLNNAKEMNIVSEYMLDKELYFECPPEVNLTLKQPLPEGWSLASKTYLEPSYPDPEVSKQTKTLLCKYHTGKFLVSQEPPSMRSECAAFEKQMRGKPRVAGFICSGVSTVYKKDDKFVKQTQAIDFESGQVGGMSAGSDLWYAADSGDPKYGLYFEPVNGAKIAYMGKKPIIQAQCKNLEDRRWDTGRKHNTVPVWTLRALDERNMNSYYCIKTNEGRYGSLLFFENRVLSNGAREALFDYKIWDHQIAQTPTRKPSITGNPKACSDAIQGKIAWNYTGSKQWGQRNIDRLCKGANQSQQPAKCFQSAMHGGVEWNGVTKWKWQDAIDLCEGSLDATKTISCYKKRVESGISPNAAVKACGK